MKTLFGILQRLSSHFHALKIVSDHLEAFFLAVGLAAAPCLRLAALGAYISGAYLFDVFHALIGGDVLVIEDDCHIFSFLPS